MLATNLCKGSVEAELEPFWPLPSSLNASASPWKANKELHSLLQTTSEHQEVQHKRTSVFCILAMAEEHVHHLYTAQPKESASQKHLETPWWGSGSLDVYIHNKGNRFHTIPYQCATTCDGQFRCLAMKGNSKPH